MHKILELNPISETARSVVIREPDIAYNSPSALDVSLMTAADPDIRQTEASAEWLNKATLEKHGIEPDHVLKNIYQDSVRGNVIKTNLYDCAYMRNAPRPDLPSATAATLINHMPQSAFLYSKGVKNQITNPYNGLTDLKGAAISFWVRVPSYFTLTNRSAILTFLGDHTYYEHPNIEQRETGVNDVWTTPYLTIEAGGNIYFNEAYHNNCCYALKGSDTTFSPDIPPYRKGLGRRWEFFTVSISDDGIDLYINGKKIEYTTKYFGKRFYGGDGNPGNSGMSTLTEFISDPDTNLYLALTILNPEGKCDQIMYDTICFYDDSIDSRQASVLYQEAIDLFNK